MELAICIAICIAIIIILCYIFGDQEQKYRKEIERLKEENRTLDSVNRANAAALKYAKQQKPPLGLLPWKFWLKASLVNPFSPSLEEMDLRVRETIRAIERYQHAGLMPKSEWTFELDYLISRINRITGRRIADLNARVSGN